MLIVLAALQSCRCNSQALSRKRSSTQQMQLNCTLLIPNLCLLNTVNQNTISNPLYSTAQWAVILIATLKRSLQCLSCLLPSLPPGCATDLQDVGHHPCTMSLWRGQMKGRIYGRWAGKIKPQLLSMTSSYWRLPSKSPDHTVSINPPNWRRGLTSAHLTGLLHGEADNYLF